MILQRAMPIIQVPQARILKRPGLIVPNRSMWNNAGSQVGGSLNVLRFDIADNLGDANAQTDYYTLKFPNPHLDGWPLWGPVVGGVPQGWTIIIERVFRQQTGYYGGVWWSNDGDFQWWNNGESLSNNSYIGICPWGYGGHTETTHIHELSGGQQGADNRANRNGVDVSVVMNVLHTQSLCVWKNVSDSSKQAEYHFNLPSTANADVIDSPDGVNFYLSGTIPFGEVNPPNPVLSIGDSNWTDSYKERFAGDLCRAKFFNKKLSVADRVSEASDMSQLKTSEGAANIWWGKTNWLSNTDLTCNYGTGRAPAWANSAYKAACVPLGTAWP